MLIICKKKIIIIHKTKIKIEDFRKTVQNKRKFSLKNKSLSTSFFSCKVPFQTFYWLPSTHHSTNRFAGGGLRGIWPRVNLLALNCSSSSWVSWLSDENRLSDWAPAPAAAEAAPNPPLVCGNALLPPAAVAAVAPAPSTPPNPAGNKPNAEADPNPGAPAGLSEGGAKEKFEAEGPAGAPKPEGGCDGDPKGLPNPAGVAAADINPNSGRFSGMPKLPVWAGAGEPKPASQMTDRNRKVSIFNHWYGYDRTMGHFSFILPLN